MPYMFNTESQVCNTKPVIINDAISTDLADREEHDPKPIEQTISLTNTHPKKVGEIFSFFT